MHRTKNSLIVCLFTLVTLIFGVNFFLKITHSYPEEISAIENSECIPRWTYTYDKNTKYNAEFIVTTEFAILSWEEALGNNNLFTLDVDSKNIIGYGDIQYEFSGLTTQFYEQNNSYVSEFNIEINPKLKSFDILYPVILHELGHTMGLEHNNNSDTTMYKYLSRIYYPTFSDIKEARKSFKNCRIRFIAR